MQLQRILALASVAVLGCAVSSAAALDFSDTTRAAPDNDDQTSSLVPNDEERIYGGTEADISKYPWTISLRKTLDGSTYCGATLVAAQYIVTAAHCAKQAGVYASIGSQYSTGSKDGERIKVSEQWVHPKYDEESHDYDVAVMKLEKPSTYKTLPLAKADGSQNKENSMAVVRGWGVTESKVPATTLLEVNVKIISNAVCNKSYDNRLTEQMICAGQGGGKDTCQGDSGGALISNDVLVGVVSWGGKCGEAPGVYVRVSTVLDFINEKIGTGGSNSTAPATPESGAPSSAPAAGNSTTPAAGNSTTPAVTTAAPAATTVAPATTAPPAATTAAPATTAPPAATTAAPAATTAAPASTPATPAATTASPSSGNGNKLPMPPSPGNNDKGVGKDGDKNKGPGGIKPKKKDCKVRL